jgi:hypothetical protein
VGAETPASPLAGTNFDLATYIGESREVQRTLVDSVKELRTDLKEFRSDVKQDFGGIKDTVAQNTADIAVLQTDMVNVKDTQAKQAETIAPIKLHPAVVTGIVVSPILAVASIVTTAIIALTPR